MQFRKRYRVVRDARGRWGVLDEWRPESGSKQAFAPYGHRCQDVVFWGAQSLNEGSLKEGDLAWEEFHPLPHHLSML